jgi:hypothetical protein
MEIRLRMVGLALLLVLLTVPARAADDDLDISAVKPKLQVVSDGKQHFIVINPEEIMDEFFFYGDGKTMWSQRTPSGGRNGDNFERTFWEPRVRALYQSSFQFKDGKYELQCDKRKTVFIRLGDDEAKALLESAKFKKPRWTHRAYALARDNTGKYFYVDKVREPEESKSFRVWAGFKGAMKPQKLTNIVSDSEGDIFATKSGSLRVVLDKHESLWSTHGKEQKLVLLPVADNVQMIYGELGVYTGEPLGTPCDDL